MGSATVLRTVGLVRIAFALSALCMSCVAIVVALDNPEIDGTSRGDSYQCLAPWDTVLLGADNYPGGEPPPDGDQIAARCVEVGEERFEVAVAWAVASGAMLVGFALVPALRRRLEVSEPV